MSRNVKRKLAIFAGTSKCLIYAEAKFCASEMPGEVKYYECLRTEYCCALGCCVSPGLLHFQHLWYYWLLVIIMFLVCSGGGWWYRYWLQGRYRAAASTIPNRSSGSRSHGSLRGSACQAQQARITYNSSRNSILLHRMWKGPQRNGASPGHQNGGATSSGHYQNMSVVLNDTSCPYYQLYGPPPSYETVIAQSRGKLSNPASPEHGAITYPCRRGAGVTSEAAVAPSQCFLYPCSPVVRLNGRIDEIPQYQSENSASRHLGNQREDVPFAHYSQHCMANGILRQNVCVPYDYQEAAAVFGCAYHANSPKKYGADKSSDTSDVENVSRVEQYTMSSNSWDHSRHSISKVHGKEGRSSRKCNKSRKTSDAGKSSKTGVSDSKIQRGSDGSGASSESELSSKERNVETINDRNEDVSSESEDFSSREPKNQRDGNEHETLSPSSSQEKRNSIDENFEASGAGSTSFESEMKEKRGSGSRACNKQGGRNKAKNYEERETCSRSSSNSDVAARVSNRSPTSTERIFEAGTGPP
ncbi:uncharacterized protein [Prorops nasuta]|uniref:uncharacterized protein n=1 Tax=Prorops nasuta TaxID=863751 RepID=UPI0034CF75B2